MYIDGKHDNDSLSENVIVLFIGRGPNVTPPPPLGIFYGGYF